MRAVAALSGLAYLAAAIAAPAQTVRQGPVTRDEAPGTQAYDVRESGRTPPPTPRRVTPSTPEEQSDVAIANEQAAIKAKADAKASIDKVNRNRSEADRYTRERAAYEAEVERVRVQKETQERAYADAMAKWEADRKACLARDYSRCVNKDGKKMK